jgi:hypothetical protein
VQTAGRDVELHVRSVITVETTPEGYAYPRTTYGFDDE